MAALAEVQLQGVWLERHAFEEAEYKYQEYLVRCKNGENKLVNGDSQKAETTAGRVAKQIAEARKQIQETLRESYSSTVSSAGAVDSNLKNEVNKLKQNYDELHKLVSTLVSRFDKLEARLSTVESKSPSATSAPPKEQPAVANADDDEDDDDDDVDFDFDADSEEDEEAERIKAERIAAYNQRKSKKTAVIAKSSILLDIKPWDDETDMAEVEKLVRSIEADGLLWGASKLVKVAFGIMKLQINCVVEDDKIGTEFLEEEITKFEDHVQSVDIAAFNKI